MRWVRWIGVALAAVYWCFEAAMDTHVFKQGAFIQRLWPFQDMNEIWMRITVVVMFLSFGAYADFLLERLDRVKIRLTRMNDCFLGFGPNPVENINRLTALCGDLLGATSAFYNRLEHGKLLSWGHWNPPQGMPFEGEATGHVCHDVIRKGSGEVMVLRDLHHTSYATTDPSIQLLGLRTYVGKAVSVGGVAVGSLCTLYNVDFEPSEDDRKLLGIIASAIGVEEVRRRAQSALRDSEEQLRHLSAELLNTQEVERKRLAARLHDSVGQSLSALKFSIEESLDQLDGEVEEKKIRPLRNAVSLIKEVVNEIRGIQRDLRPPMLDDLGIIATLKSFAKRFQDVYESIELETRFSIKEEDVPRNLKIVIYRIIQEAMNNVARHSKAKSAHIELSKTADSLRLVVWDDGEGFDAEQALAAHYKKGLGLSSMKERAELSKGVFRIKSRRKEGTRIEVAWPLGAEIFTGSANPS